MVSLRYRSIEFGAASRVKVMGGYRGDFGCGHGSDVALRHGRSSCARPWGIGVGQCRGCDARYHG